MNTHDRVSRTGRRMFPVAVLLSLLLVPALAAAADGTVIDVKGKTVYIELMGGAPPRVGDNVELSFDMSGERFVIGTWRVSKVSGPVVEAQPVDERLPAQKGMQARIGGAPPPPVQPKPAPAPAPQKPKPAEAPPAPPPAAAQPPVRAQPQKSAPTAAVKAAPMVPAETSQTVQFIKTARYERIWDDKRSGARVDFAVWRPVAQKDFLPLGDVGIAGRLDDDRYPPPTAETYLVRNGVPPVSYRKIWSSEGSGSKRPFSSWLPVPPDGYKCVGDVGSESLTEPPSLDAVRCVPANCVIETELGEEIWEDKGSGAVENFSAWRVPKVNTYIGNASHKRPRGIFYTLNDACL